jgi:hypothetical protein
LIIFPVFKLIPNSLFLTPSQFFPLKKFSFAQIEFDSSNLFCIPSGRVVKFSSLNSPGVSLHKSLIDSSFEFRSKITSSLFPISFPKFLLALLIQSKSSTTLFCSLNIFLEQFFISAAPIIVLLQNSSTPSLNSKELRVELIKFIFNTSSLWHVSGLTSSALEIFHISTRLCKSSKRLLKFSIAIRLI